MRIKFFLLAIFLSFLFLCWFVFEYPIRSLQDLLERTGFAESSAVGGGKATQSSYYRIDETIATSLKWGEQSKTKSVGTEHLYSWQQLLLPLSERFNANKEVLLDRLLRYRDVSVIGNQRLTSEEVLHSAGPVAGEWAWSLPPVEIQQRLESSAWIEAAELSLEVYPLRLNISVREALPWLVAEYQGRSWIVSTSGELIETLEGLNGGELVVESSRLPRLTGLDLELKNQSILSSPNSRFNYAVKLLRMLESSDELPFAVDQIALLPEGDLRMSPARVGLYPDVLLSPESIAQGKTTVERLKAVLADIKERGERPREVDLRFADQVIVR